MKKIGIIGGGISGLTVAFLLKNKGFEITLFEKSNQVGGNIQTVKIDDFLIECAPNSLIKSPRLVDLIKELTLETQILTANPNNKKRYVLQNGKLRALPMSIGKIAFDGYFSIKAKLRLLKESLIKSKSKQDESIAEFFERRLGREVLEKAADPFISGIFAGNPENLSIKSAFPRLYKLEKDYGSLLIGSLFAKSEKTDKNFPHSFSFKNGIQTLTDKLAENLGERVQTNTEILQIEKTLDEKISVKTISGENIFDAIIISTPAESAAKLIENLDTNLSENLKSICYPPVAMVFFGVKKENIGFDPDGFGFLIPGSEKRRILGTLWNSAVFANRAPDGYHLLTTFVGGSRNAEMCSKTDDEIIEIVFEELKDILNLKEKPNFTHIKRWQKAIPQYNLGYEKIENGIENFSAKHTEIFFCSNFYKGISIGDCVKNAYGTVEKIEEISHKQTRKGTK